MSRRDKYPDRQRAASVATIVQFRPGEDPMDRHRRRLETNLAALAELKLTCERAGITVDVKNEGQHWIFKFAEGRRAEWWPSSAKLVFDQRWKQGIHVHDHLQLWRELERKWGVQAVSG